MARFFPFSTFLSVLRFAFFLGTLYCTLAFRSLVYSRGYGFFFFWSLFRKAVFVAI